MNCFTTLRANLSQLYLLVSITKGAETASWKINAEETMWYYIRMRIPLIDGLGHEMSPPAVPFSRSSSNAEIIFRAFGKH